jgi:hypothetical protein
VELFLDDEKNLRAKQDEYEGLICWNVGLRTVATTPFVFESVDHICTHLGLNIKYPYLKHDFFFDSNVVNFEVNSCNFPHSSEISTDDCEFLRKDEDSNICSSPSFSHATTKLFCENGKFFSLINFCSSFLPLGQALKLVNQTHILS